MDDALDDWLQKESKDHHLRLGGSDPSTLRVIRQEPTLPHGKGLAFEPSTFRLKAPQRISRYK